MTLYNAFGDSLGNGYGASVPAKSWNGLFSPYDVAHNGDMTADCAKAIQSSTQAVCENTVLIIGENDARIYQGDPAKISYFKKFLRTCALYAMLPDKIVGRAPAGLLYTGTWYNPTGTAIGKGTTQNGATVSGSFVGDILYIGHEIQNAQLGTADVYVDNVLIGSYGTSGNPVMTTANGLTYGAATERYAHGQGSGAHTFKIVVTSSTGAYLYFDYVAGNEQGSMPTKTILANITRMTAAGYASFGGSDANTDAYNAVVSDIVSELAGDGFNIVLCDNHAIIDPATDLISDGLHWNDGGHLKVHNLIRTFLA